MEINLAQIGSFILFVGSVYLVFFKLIPYIDKQKEKNKK